jgi:hypothetical protein
MALPKVRYTARRSLMAGVSNGQTITLELPVKYAGISREVLPYHVYEKRSMSGIWESYNYPPDIVLGITTIPVDTTKQAQLQQFLDSVMGRYRFEFDETGTNSWVYVTLNGTSYNRVVSESNDSRATYAFSIARPMP